MNQEILIRLLWALAIVGAGLAAYALANRLLLARAQRRAETKPLPGLRRGTPAILYFTTPECVPCKTVQRPVLARLQARLGERLQVIEVDASRQPDLASAWGVLSVPTTFLIDARGRAVHVNHGVTREEQLLAQVGRL